MDTLDSNVIARFWTYVEKTETCWLWIGALSDNGYGRLHVHRRSLSVHRLSYVIHRGAIPEGQYVLHHCDRRACIRPDHLFLGTHLDNINDMLQKKRHLMATDPERILAGVRRYNAGNPERPWLSGMNHWSQHSPECVLRGSAHPRSKLTEDDVRAIRRRFQAVQDKRGLLRELAQSFHVSTNTIGSIVRGEAWKHVLVY